MAKIIGGTTATTFRVPKDELATKDYVDEKVGDIEAALDGIIAIQESLIGGETV